MNWTGGSLQRTKNANKGVVQKQKAYFARARIQLQNGPQLPVTPFRPSYFWNDDERDLGGRTTKFGLRSVRHTGRSARQCHEETRRETSEKLDKKRKAADANIEMQLLEANRRRLLRQHDWVSIALSKPVDLQFPSSKEKERIGKRRKVNGRRGATARWRSNLKLADRPLQPANDDCAFMSRALCNDAGDIRIRIGTDALITAYSIQPDDCAKSQVSSDLMLFDPQTSSECMLFDHEAQDAEPQIEPGKAKSIASETYLLAEQPRQSINHKHQWPEEQTQLYDSDLRRNQAISSQEPDAEDSGDSNQAELTTTSRYAAAVETKDRGSEASAPSFQIIHRIEGAKRPLRLMFEDSSSSAGAHSRIASQHDSVGERNRAHEADHAGPSLLRRMHQASSESRQHIVDKALAIADEESWKSYIVFPNESSTHSPAAQGPGTSFLHSYPTARNNEADLVNWSQHATQGNYTRVSSVSASLPSLRRPGEKLPVHQTTSRKMDDDERVWQNFVFGSYKNSDSETTNEDSEQRTSNAFRGSSNPPLPVSFTYIPFRSGLASCISNNVQDAAAFAPSSGFRSITPHFHGLAGELDEGQQGDDVAFGEQSVNGAYLQDNASCEIDLVSSRMFDDTRTSCSSLSRSDCTSYGFSGRAPVSRSELRRVQHSSSSYDIPVSSDNNLDLVNPDSLV